MTVPTVYLDTNVFILLGEGTGDTQRALVELIGGQPSGAPARLATSELTLAELLTKPHADGRDDLIDLYDRWVLESSWLQVGSVTRDALWYAGVLCSNYRSLKLPDAIHLATALGFACSYFMTADEGLKDRYAISHSRYGATRLSSEIAVVRPDIETIIKLQTDLGNK